MELIDSYRRQPGCCAVCSSPSVGKGAIDLGFEDRGSLTRRFQVYLCSDCAFQVASLVVPLYGKVILPARHSQETAMLHNELAVEKAKVSEYEKIMAAIRGLDAVSAEDDQWWAK